MHKFEESLLTRAAPERNPRVLSGLRPRTPDFRKRLLQVGRTAPRRVASRTKASARNFP